MRVRMVVAALAAASKPEPLRPARLLSVASASRQRPLLGLVTSTFLVRVGVGLKVRVGVGDRGGVGWGWDGGEDSDEGEVGDVVWDGWLGGAQGVPAGPLL